jgi:hypothetical protein
MRIIITPEDIVKRCLWDTFVYYILGKDKNPENILKENKEFTISEKDALVIGLLKCVETPNLIYRFNTQISDFLINRSITQGKLNLVRKKSILISIDKFLNKFPDYWTPSKEYETSIKDLKEYTEEVKESIDKVDIHEVTDQFGTHEYINSNNVKKILKFNYK